jgi:hypothetical protein
LLRDQLGQTALQRAARQGRARLLLEGFGADAARGAGDQIDNLLEFLALDLFWHGMASFDFIWREKRYRAILYGA